MYKLRPYQQSAHDAVVDWWKHTTEPCVVEAATGSGKSLIVASLAKTLYDLSGGKRVLCLAPSAELIEQNAEKYKALGEPCSVYSASLSKSLRHQVVFATEGTFKKVAKRLGPEFAGVIIDECHRVTPTITKIIDEMREGKPHLRVCGLSGTPYRLGTGFVFAIDLNGNPIPESQTRDPYFKKLVYFIGAEQLVNEGYLTPPTIGAINASGYDTSALVVQKNGNFNKASVDKAFAGWGRKTASIVADIVTQSMNKKGVMIFAATVKHAEEVMASLPPHLSALVTGGTKQAERKSIIKRFKNQQIKYLVNVSVLCTGFDATHVDVVAILRATESISLLQQIIGRGLRLHEGKTECLILDYADNIEKHCPDGDVFKPEIKAQYQGSESESIECKCEQCNGLNVFTARKNDSGFDINEHGYFCDIDGETIEVDIGAGVTKSMPAHFGRRCQQQTYNKKTKMYEQCDYLWSFKECADCEHKNDVTARYCQNCKAELIDPNDKLKGTFKAKKANPRELQCDEILTMEVIESISKAGNPMVRVTFTTAYRLFTVYYQTEAKTAWLANKYEFFKQHTKDGTVTPKTVSYTKEKDFWEIKGFNQPTDEEVLNNALSE